MNWPKLLWYPEFCSLYSCEHWRAISRLFPIGRSEWVTGGLCRRSGEAFHTACLVIWVMVLNKWSNVYAGIRDLVTGHHVSSNPLWNVRAGPSPWAGFQARPNNPFLQQLRTDTEAYILYKSKLILSCNPQLVDRQPGSFSHIFSNTNPSLSACHPSSSQQSFSTNWFSRWKFTAALDQWMSPKNGREQGTMEVGGSAPSPLQKGSCSDSLGSWAPISPFSPTTNFCCCLLVGWGVVCLFILIFLFHVKGTQQMTNILESI